MKYYINYSASPVGSQGSGGGAESHSPGGRGCINKNTINILNLKVQDETSNCNEHSHCVLCIITLLEIYRTYQLIILVLLVNILANYEYLRVIRYMHKIRKEPKISDSWHSTVDT